MKPQKFNLSGAQFTGGFAENVQGDQHGGVIINTPGNPKGDALFFRVALSGKESSGFSPSSTEEIIKRHQQQLADELGKEVSWDTAATGYFRELETEFRNLCQDAYSHCRGLENDTVLPSEG